jgi:peptidase MA superfamily protein
VSGDLGRRGKGTGAAAHLALLLLQVPQAVTVGRVTAVASPGHGPLAAALAAAADRTPPFPGIGPLPDRPIRLILAPTRARFDSLTRGRLPPWSEGAAFPDVGTIVLLTTRPPDRLAAALRHELAHLVLRWRLGHPPPLWFDEGYAAFAAGEWDRLEALRLNWQIARGMRMDLADVDRALRSDEADAQTAYALATTAVLLLNRWGGAQGLAPLIDRLADLPTFDAAVRATYHVTEGDFEARWERDVASRYGLLSWAGAVGLFWTLLALLLVSLVGLRRRRDRARKARLDEGWTVPEDEGPSA